MIRNHRTLRVALLLGLLAAGSLHAVGEGRLQGTVLDQDGAPVVDAKVTVSVPGSSYKQERKTDKKGRFTVLVVDVSRNYVIKLEKEGYSTVEGPIKFTVGDTARQEFTMPKLSTAEVQRQQMSEEEIKALEGKNEAVAAFNEGVPLLQAKDFAGAAAKFEQAIQLDPALAPAYSVLADVYFEQGKYKEALAAADKYLELKPGEPKGMYTLRFDAYKALGDKEKTAEALEAMIKNEPGRDTAARVYNLGAEAHRKDDTATAIKLMQKALEIDPKLETGYSTLGTIYLRQKNHQEALSMADRLLQMNPTHAEALSIRYEALKALGRKEDAKAAYEAMQGLTANQTADEAFKQGVALYNANNIPEASKAFERALAKDPKHAKAHFLLGLCHASKGENGKAKEYLQAFINLAPNDPDAKDAKEILASLK